MGVRYGDPAARAARLRRELAAIVPRLVDDETDRILLFGSAARGDVHGTSDIDLLVVRRDPRPPAARVADLYRRARSRVSLDLLVYTPDELEAARETSSFLRTALRDAEVLHERV